MARGYHVGGRVILTQDFDLMPYALVREGETGTVVRSEPLTGYAWIKLDTFHRGLVEYENCIWLNPYNTEEFMECVKSLHQQEVQCGQPLPSLLLALVPAV